MLLPSALSTWASTGQVATVASAGRFDGRDRSCAPTAIACHQLNARGVRLRPSATKQSFRSYVDRLRAWPCSVVVAETPVGGSAMALSRAGE
jgi:hypothetical protein